MRTPVVRGISFHGIGTPQRELEPGEDRYWISVATFEGILDRISDRVDVRITFDDGNASDVEIGLPALRERGLVASFFVVAGRIGSFGSLGRDDLLELARCGMTIGTHGMDHRPWRGLSALDRERELVEARERIAQAIGRPVDAAAVPLGLYDRRTLDHLRRLGYRTVYTSERMPANEGAWLQPRFSVRASDTVESFALEALSNPRHLRRAWLETKSRVKRLR